MKNKPSILQIGKVGRTAATFVLLAALQRFISLLILPFIAHVMSPAEYGKVATLTSAAILLIAVFAGPIDTLVFRMFHKTDDTSRGILRIAGLYSYVFFPMFGLTVACIFAIFSPSLLGVSASIWAIEILALSLQAPMTVFALPLVQSAQNLPKFVLLAGSSTVVYTISKFVLIVVLEKGLFGWVLSDLICAVFSSTIVWTMIRVPLGNVTRKDIRGFLRFCLPIIPHKSAYWAITSLSRPLLASVSTMAQVGLLSLGLNIVAIASMVISEFNRAVQPRYSQETFPAPTRLTLTPIRWQLTLSLIVPTGIGASLALFGHWFLPESYLPSYSVVGILLIGQVAYGVYPIAINYLVLTSGLPKFSAYASGAGAVVILGSILIFGHQYGAIGAAYGTSVGYVMMTGVALSLTRVAKLDISWRHWFSCWPELSLGLFSLTLTIIALSRPASTISGRTFALASLASLVVAALMFRQNRLTPDGPSNRAGDLNLPH